MLYSLFQQAPTLTLFFYLLSILLSVGGVSLVITWVLCKI